MTEATDNRNVDLEISGHVASVVFNQPSRHNAMSFSMWQQLAAHMQQLASSEQPNVRVVVLTGAGERSFVSGSDISEFHEQRSGDDAINRYNKIAADAETSVYNCPLPTIAKINGYCMGGGLGIAMGCDLRLCSDDAVFSLPAGRLGLGYEFDAVCKLFDLLGPTATSQLFYSGKKLNATQALELGLVNQVVHRDALEEEVNQLAEGIAQQAPLTLKAYKAALLEYRKPAQQRDVAAISQMVNHCYTSSDYAEGQAAFREKRQPEFKGV